MDFTFIDELTVKDAVILFFYENNHELMGETINLNKQTGQAIFKALTETKFTGKEGQVYTLNNPFGTEFSKIVMVGLGKQEKLSCNSFMKSLALAIKEVAGSNLDSVQVIMDNIDNAGVMAAKGALAVSLALYRFDDYKTTLKDKDLPSLNTVTFILSSDNVTLAKEAFVEADALAQGIATAKDLINQPANALYPETFADEVEKLSSLGAFVEILSEDDLKSQGLNMILAVGKGSSHPARLAIIKYNGKDNSNNYPLCLIGKGITFDAGGISLKPARNMAKMKYDLSGACGMMGTMKVLCLRKAKVNVIALLPMAENMPDGNAVKPSDILKSYSGKTVEVDNTDAEGRLVLADAISYAEKNFKPEYIIDMATLTGAITAALGSKRAGLFTNDSGLRDALIQAGDETDELLWNFPMDSDYNLGLKSDFADIKNCSDTGEAGSISAAKFLEFFLHSSVDSIEDKDNEITETTETTDISATDKAKTKWAHLDIAGVAWTISDKPLCPKGTRGFGILLLNQFIKNTFE